MTTRELAEHIFVAGYAGEETPDGTVWAKVAIKAAQAFDSAWNAANPAAPGAGQSASAPSRASRRVL